MFGFSLVCFTIASTISSSTLDGRPSLIQLQKKKSSHWKILTPLTFSSTMCLHEDIAAAEDGDGDDDDNDDDTSMKMMFHFLFYATK